MGGEATLDAWVTFSGEAIRFSSCLSPSKPSDGGLWHPILMQFYSGPLMHLLSGVDTIRCASAAFSKPITKSSA